MNKTEKVHSKYYNLLQTNTEFFSQLEVFPKLITRAITANRPIDHNFDELSPVQSKITEKFIAQKLNQNTTTGFQPRTQSTSVTLNPNINNDQTTGSISPDKVTVTSIPVSSALIPDLKITLRIPTITI